MERKGARKKKREIKKGKEKEGNKERERKRRKEKEGNQDRE